ncbi:MAG: hypothetical protein JO308_02710 [Verrucomicrobia bacterium]|nr:hypothetical protein [Verrucomicrobiota bacterium]
MNYASNGRIPVVSRMVLPWILGAAAFVLVTGGGILNPVDFRWLLPGDGGMNLLGWMFFRNAPFWQQPFGAVWPYGMSISGSLVYSDSIPLLAFLFKPFSGLLPTDFQYFGLWTLICFLLQSFFGWKLLERLSGERANLFGIGLGTAFFLVAPALVWRIHWHLALGSHWIILAGILLYFSSKFKAWPWILLCIVASLVTPIILAMVFPLFGAALVKHYLNGKANLRQVVWSLVATCSLLILTSYEAGYFMVHDVGEGGFGIYRSSVLSFIEPAVGDLTGSNSWSYLLPDQTQGPGTYEGYAFLGTGVIILLFLGLFQLVRSRKGFRIPAGLWPLLVVLAGFTLFAWSNHVGPAREPLFQIGVPFDLERIIAPFRASGRYIWPLYYFAIACIVSTVIRSFKNWTGIALLGICLTLQIADSSRAFSHNRALYRIAYAYKLESPFWQQVGNRYQKFIFVLPQDKPVDFFPLCYFAASHRLPITVCHYGRRSEQQIETAAAQTFEALNQTGLDPNALYAFQNGALWSVGLSKMGAGDLAGYADNVAFIAPRWGTGLRQDTRSLLQQVFPDYHPGTVLNFGRDGNGLVYLANGWSSPEANGSWSLGEKSSVIIPLSEKGATDLILNLTGLAFVHPKWPKQTIGISANGVTLASLDCSIEDSTRNWSIRIPHALLDKGGNLLTLGLSTPDSVIPADLGLFLDMRKVGFSLQSLVLRPPS